MSDYYTPIPRAIMEQVPNLAYTEGKCPFDIRIQPFDGDGGEQMYSLDVWTEPFTVRPEDRRKNSHVEAKLTSYFFDEAGNMTEDSPVSYGTKYRG